MIIFWIFSSVLGFSRAFSAGYWTLSEMWLIIFVSFHKIIFFFCITFIFYISAITGDFVLPLCLSITDYFVLSSLGWSWSVMHFRFCMRDVFPFPFRPVISIQLWILFFYQSDINKVVLVRSSLCLYNEIISFYNNADDCRPSFPKSPLKKLCDNGQCQNEGHIWWFVLFSAPYQSDRRIAKTVSTMPTVQSAHANVSSWMVG